ncbi:MAG: hypothetical protein H6577_24255 [Lewinellaceae bacterium]|nr:hypothetical protein [Saprospiraceae bacterium]MCB9341248.1 hypothetical protein [Lewinellaceae bacterium]
MRNIKISLAAIFSALLLTFQFGCKYDEILPPAPKDDVTFSGDVIPVFNQSCNTAGCHGGGASDVAPDLSPANAYNALFTGGFIDTLQPDNSKLYRWMAGEEKVPMPPEGANSFYNATVLKWIELGAKEN